MKAKKPTKCPVCGKPIVDYREYVDGMIVAVHSVTVELGMFANMSDNCTIASPQPLKEKRARETYRYILERGKMASKKAFKIAKTISADNLFNELTGRGFIYVETKQMWRRKALV